MTKSIDKSEQDDALEASTTLETTAEHGGPDRIEQPREKKPSEKSVDMALSQERAEDKELERWALRYDPEAAKISRGKLVWSFLAIAIVGIMVGAAVVMGIMKLNRTPSTTEREPPQEDDLLIVGAQEGAILFLGSSRGERDEILVASVTTDTLEIKDLTRGSSHVIAAALSLQGDRLLYIQEQEGHRAAIVSDMASGTSSEVESSKLDEAAGGVATEPCSWSSIVWSPDAKRFAFFGCDKTTSVLVVVEAETELSPIVIEATRSAQTPPRQVFWLDSKSIIYTERDASRGETWVKRITGNSKAVPTPIYGK